MGFRYSRSTSLFFVAISLVIGLPLAKILTADPLVVDGGGRWICWGMATLCAMVLVQGVRLLVAPPIVLALTPEGIRIHYNAGNAGYTKNSDLLPWRLIDGMQLARLHTLKRGRKAWFWTVKLALSSPPPFDACKRDPIQPQRGFFPEPGPNVFHIVTSGVFNVSKEALLASLQSGLRQWQQERAGESDPHIRQT